MSTGLAIYNGQVKLQKALSNVGTAHIALAISMIALTVSAAQFYVSNFYKWSQLKVLVSQAVVSAENPQVQENGNVHFVLRTYLALSAVNYGNAPAALLKIYMIVPIKEGMSCASVPPIPEDLSPDRYNDMVVNAYAIPIEPTTVQPGAIVTLSSHLRFENAVRWKWLVGKPIEVCLAFVALDHNANRITKTVNGWSFMVSQNNSGYKPADDLHKPITIIAH